MHTVALPTAMAIASMLTIDEADSALETKRAEMRLITI